eukprot:TRINITY_DN27746_c0_g1_i1.p1 TRINITY_DN27746_c0_g1~~TRINITY_DN27746_c0_g1_i1.p1  ORF type:complete len:559 (+),score=179.48 TRINITY_DN27746_c0_g1_i1:49-1725(+)
MVPRVTEGTGGAAEDAAATKRWISPQRRPEKSPCKRRKLLDGASTVTEGADYLGAMLVTPAGDIATQTPVSHARILSGKLSSDVYFKREESQVGFSHCVRSAYAMVAALTAEERAKGIVASGLGNFGYGVAVSCQKLGITSKLTVVVPKSTPAVLLKQLKWDTISAVDLSVIVEGCDAHEAATEAEELAGATGATLLVPYRGVAAVAGMGSLATEIFQQKMDVDVIYVSVGYGNAAAALLEYVASIHPRVRIVAVEAQDNHAFSRAVKSTASDPDAPYHGALNHFVDGTATAVVNPHAVAIARKRPDHLRFITVSNDEVSAAIKAVFLDTRTVLNPTGALAVAGAKKDALAGKKSLVVLGSSNLEFNTLRTIAERCEESETLVHLRLPEEKGAFKKMYSVVYPRAVTEFSYRFNKDSNAANVFMSFQDPDPASATAVIKALNAAGYPSQCLSDDELAKSHARYLVGGRGAPPDERLIQFSFPQGPEALSRFLDVLPSFASITLFHYRNHGADFGKVLVGFDVPCDEELQFQTFLSTLRSNNYEYTDETTNPVYRLFLR